MPFDEIPNRDPRHRSTLAPGRWGRMALLGVAAATALGFGAFASLGVAVAVLSFVAPAGRPEHALVGSAAAVFSGWWCRLGVRDLCAIVARRWP